MARIGSLRSRVTFQAASYAADGGGGSAVSWSDVVTVWGQFMPARGRERVNAGRLEDNDSGVLMVRSSSEVTGITTEHRVTVDGVAYNIRSITNPDRRSRFLEMVVDKGGDRGAAT